MVVVARLAVVILAVAGVTVAAAREGQPSVRQAIELYEADRFADAERVVQAVVTKAPADMAARLLLGWAQWSQGRYDESLATFKAVLHEAPPYRRPTWDEYADFQLPREIESIDNPDLEGARNGLGWTYLKKGWPRSALAVFERLVERAPSWDLPRLGRGYAALALGDRERARADFDVFAQKTAKPWLAERALGDLAQAAGRPHAAIAHYERALAKKPHWTEVKTEIAWARAGGRPALDHAWALYREGKARDAATAFDALVKKPLPPDGRVSALNGLGWALLGVSDHEAAERAFAESLKTSPAGAEATAGRGWVALGRKDWAVAERAFADAVTIVPGLESAVKGTAALREARYGPYDRAWALHGAAKPAEARALFAKLLQTPGDLPPAMKPFVRAGIAWCDLALHQADKAEPVFRELATAGGDIGAEATAGLGWVALDRGQFVEARRHLDDSLRAAPRQAFATRGLVELRKREIPDLDAAWTRYFARQYQEAATAFTSVAARPGLAAHYRTEARRGLAWSLTWLGRAEEAAREFSTLVAEAPDADAWWGAGLALTRAGRPRDAVDRLQRAVDLAPDSADVRIALGWALLKGGNAAAAEDAFRAAQKRAPASAEAHRGIAWARTRLSHLADPMEPFRHAIAHIPGVVDDDDFRALVKTKDYRPLRRDLAWSYVRWHGFMRARDLFDELVQEDRHDGDALFGLGYAEYKLEQYASADTHLARATAARRRPAARVVWVMFPDVGAQPILTDAWSIRGWVAFFRKDFAAARARFAESLDRDPELVSSLGGLAMTLERAGNRAGALELYRRAAEIYPTYPVVVAGLRASDARGASGGGR